MQVFVCLFFITFFCCYSQPVVTLLRIGWPFCRGCLRPLENTDFTWSLATVVKSQLWRSNGNTCRLGRHSMKKCIKGLPWLCLSVSCVVHYSERQGKLLSFQNHHPTLRFCMQFGGFHVHSVKYMGSNHLFFLIVLSFWWKGTLDIKL